MRAAPGALVAGRCALEFFKGRGALVEKLFSYVACVVEHTSCAGGDHLLGEALLSGRVGMLCWLKTR